jgi:hypothetical protein
MEAWRKMKINKQYGKSSREEFAQWWADMSPLTRRMGVRWGACLVVLAGLWIAGAHYSARYNSLTPSVGLQRIDLREYVKRGENIPKEDNAATILMQLDRLIETTHYWKSKSDEALRLCRNFEDNSYKPKDADWQVLAAFAAETDPVIRQVREAQKCPKCAFSLSLNNRCGDYYYDRSPDAVGSLLVIRARVAGHFGNGPGWRQAMEDLLGFVETIHRDQTPVVAVLERRTLKGLLKALEDGCASGAADEDAFLAKLDGRLAAMRPMEGIESLLALAWSSMDFRRSLRYWNVYPRYFSERMVSGEPSYNDIIDIPYRTGGFAARDRMLSAAYMNGLLDILRSGQPNAHVQAWTWMSGPAWRAGLLGREFAPRYNELSSSTPHIEWAGSPGTLYANAAFVNMARAVIAVMRHGRDEKGLFRDVEYLKKLLRDLPCPMTGAPIVFRTNPHFYELWYDVARGPWRERDHWEVYATIKTPASKQ